MTFEAKYDGTCTDCGGHISIGTPIESDPRGKGYKHETCPDDPAVSLRPNETVCEECFLVHPAGVCDA